MNWTCSECETEFLQDKAERCLKCGSVHISLVPGEIVDPRPNGESEKPANEHIRQILFRLCDKVYDHSFRGVEWERLISEAVEEMRPYLKV